MDHEDRDASALIKTIERLDKAQRQHREAGERDATARNVFEMLEAVQNLGRHITVRLAARFEDALRALEWAYSGVLPDELRVAPGIERAAQTWLLAAGHAAGRKQTDAYRRTAALARRLIETLDVTDDLRARGWFLLGNALGGAMLNAVSTASQNQAASRKGENNLNAAIAAFERARDLFDFAGADIMSVRSRIRLAVALSASVSHFNRRERIEACKFAWREAAAFAADDDLLRCRLNLASVLLGSAGAGNPADLDIAGSMLMDLVRDTAGHPEYQASVAQSLKLFRSLGMQQVQSEASSSYPHALALAKDPARRRQYLSQAARDLPETGASEAAIRTNFLGVIMELRRLREAGVARTDIGQWREALAFAARERAMTEEMAQNAQQAHSGAAGKALLSAHLAKDAPFVLLLRSFQLETREVPGPPKDGADAETAYLDLIGGGHTGWRLSSIASRHALAQALTSVCPTLLIVNRDDSNPPAAAAKLFEPAHEWRKLVFCLVAEANAIVVSVPADLGAVSGGLSHELRAIADLDARSRTVLLLQPRDRSLFGGAPDNAPSPALPGRLRNEGFAHMVAEGETKDDAAAIATAVRSILARASGSRATT